MAKAVLEFDLTNPDDKLEHYRAIKSTDMALVLWHLLYNTKKELLRELEASEFTGEDADHDYDLLDKIFAKIHELVSDHGIVIDDLIS